ncbi:MAG: D-alanyl-D-alanine carboxypeptidase family protein [Rhodobiaceae bacterium]|nr:D-alanyl-D-alanine carboxypeptidase family protein [Rhodobiaceae bacterium]
MSNSVSVQRDTSVLHPAIRDAVLEVEKKLNAEKIPFKIFEAYRSPQRQAFLFSKGRTRSGPKVTNAPAWSSFHQYGLAVDFVLFRPDVKGGWSWDTSGKWGRAWDRLHEVGAEFGLMPLSWEKPHLQITGVSISDLRNGHYPSGGDEAWAGNLESMIVGWSGRPMAPDVPKILPSRPPIGDDAVTMMDSVKDDDDAEDVLRPAAPGSAATASAPHDPRQFAKVQPIVDKWEGGYVNHPLDRGGPTNMGITLATLSAWRGRRCSPSDVKALTRKEAWEIYKSRYYDVVHGDDLPLSVALAAHNAAVLHGTKRSGRFLQQALGAAGHAVEVDGIVGRETVGAVAHVDPVRLTDCFFDAQREYFRNIERNRPQDWRAFGKGWMNRFSDIKSSAHSFAQSISVPEPIDVPLPPIRPEEKDDEKRLLHSMIGNLIDRVFDDGDDTPAVDAGTVKPAPRPEFKGIDPDRVAAVIGIAQALSKSDVVKNPTLKAALDALAQVNPKDPVLTTVNGAFGKTIGRMLDGRKTAIGIVGTLLVTLLDPNKIALVGTIIGTAPAQALLGSTGLLMPVTVAMTAWGILGKIEKWVVLRK